MSLNVASLGEGRPEELGARRIRVSAERRFYLVFTIAIMAAVLLGFARTFFLRHWYPEWAAVHAAPEAFFYLHGVVFTAWFVTLIVQASLVSARRVDLHRRFGKFGAGLAAAMVVVGTIGALIGAGRSTGFVDVGMPPLQFLAVPLAIMVLFGVFVALAIVNRRNPQSHKRYMILASITLIEAAIARWPFALVNAESPVPLLSTLNLLVDLYLVPLIVWDFATRRRIHPVTLWGGLALIASHPLRLMVAQTSGWMAFAGWSVHLIGR